MMNSVESRLAGLSSEILCLNDRLICGDISSPRFAITQARTICADYTKSPAGPDLMLEPFIAAGGFIGIRWCVQAADHGEINGSIIPRRRNG